MTQQHSIVTELSQLDDQYLKQLPLHIVTFLSREGTTIRVLVNAPGCNGVMLLARWILQPSDDLSWFVRNSWSVNHDRLALLAVGLVHFAAVPLTTGQCERILARCVNYQTLHQSHASLRLPNCSPSISQDCRGNCSHWDNLRRCL